MTTNDRAVMGGSAAEIIRQMRADSWFAEDNKGDYMNEVSRRVFEENGATIRTDTAVNFLTDLQAAGLITLGDAQ